MKTILVTGATGNLGRAVVSALAAKGFIVKSASRHPQPSGVRFDYDDPATHGAALDGVEGVMLIAPPLDAEADRKLIPFIDRAKSRGIQHFVLNSALGVEANETAPLRKVERHLLGLGVETTILRPNFFMENFTSGFLAPMIRQGKILLAASDGKTSFISVDDIAAVAALAFNGGHSGKEYNLTGPAALDHSEVAHLISQACGRTITYQSLSEEAMLQGARQNGLPEGSVQFLGLLYTVVRNGWAARLTVDVQQVTGRMPTSFATFAARHAALWK